MRVVLLPGAGLIPQDYDVARLFPTAEESRVIAIPWFGGVVGGNTVSAASPADIAKWHSDVVDGVRKEIVSFQADVVVAHSAGAQTLNAILPEELPNVRVVTFGARFFLKYKHILALVGDADELVGNTDGCTIVPNCGHLGILDEQAWQSAVSRNDEIALTMDYVKKGPFTCRPRPDVIANIAAMIAEFSAEKPDPMLTLKPPSFCRCWQ